MNRLLLLQGLTGKKAFKFDPATATFTPSMAKRNSAGPFAAGVLVQGSSTNTSDMLMSVRGTKIADSFYPTFDYNQGTIVFWITPEWNGNDGKFHVILTGSSSVNVPGFIYKWTNNTLCIEGSSAGGVDISSWVAGNTYCVVIRWDKNTLDGINYTVSSINDVHTFRKTGQLSTVSPTDFIAIGATYGWQSPADALIEGLTIYRRVLFDGSYGTDIGNGDELAQIYNGGAGKDPTEITGSWDVCFCLPTSATPGALVTGTGEAWSHPHSSNLVMDGWMAEGYYGGGDSVVQFNGINTSINCGSDAALDNLHDNAFTTECWIKLNAHSNGAVIIYKGWGNGVGWGIVGTLDGITSFVYATPAVVTSSAPLLLNRWYHLALTWDDAGDRKIRLFINGILTLTSSAAVGVIIPDDNYALLIGGVATNYTSNSLMGWVRISNSIRYTSNFIPSRLPPTVDANTVGQWNMAEGSGTIVDNAQGAATRDGVITNGTWANVWNDVGTPKSVRSVVFNGTSTNINVGSHASVDNLADNAFTIESYIKPSLLKSWEMIASKSLGWELYLNSTSLCGSVFSTPTQASTSINFNKADLGKWHHLAMTFDDAGDRKVRIWLNGLLLATSSAGVGPIIVDAASNLMLGDTSTNSIDGGMGWTRISNSIRYTENFTPPSRANPPLNDANTVRLFKMDEGAGNTIIDYSTNAQNAVLTNGTWNNTRDMASGEKVYAWGTEFGSDAVNEGVGQIIPSTDGQNFVLKPVIHYDKQATPKLRVLDATNGNTEITSIMLPDQKTNLVVNGGFDVDANWSLQTGWTISGGMLHCSLTAGQYSAVSYPNVFEKDKTYRIRLTASNRVGGTYYIQEGSNSTIYNISSNGLHDLVFTAKEGGFFRLKVDSTNSAIDFDDISITRVIDSKRPWSEHISFEAPTIARNGVAADCTKIAVQVINTASEGVVSVHQVELLNNLIDNPGFETGSGDPWIPSGWTNGNLDIGDSIQENSIVHSNGKSLKLKGLTEYMESGNTLAPGRFISVGSFARDGNVGFTAGNDSFPAQARGIVLTLATNNTTPYYKPFRCVNKTTISYFGMLLLSYTESFGYIDDVYAIALDPITLTVTPASLANSMENGGIRVDGNDTLVQAIPLGKLTSTKGRVKIRVTPRVSSLVSYKFGTSSTLISIEKSPLTSIRVLISAFTDSMFLIVNTGSGDVATSIVAPNILAGASYLLEVKYSSSGVSVYIDGIIKLTLSMPIDFGVNVPNRINISNSNSVFSAP